METPQVVFVLGAPGSGKGTQCSKIAKNFGYCHVCAGDLLRNEIKNHPDSADGREINEYMKEGKIVPVNITCRLIEKAICASKIRNILIDGFPRNGDNLSGWNQQMGEKTKVKFVIYFECPEEVCTQRILERGKNSGRHDDNRESLKKRFISHEQETMPVVDHYRKKNLVHTINSEASPETVFQEVEKLFVQA